MGRTHGIHAEPTTFGLKLAGWAFELAAAASASTRALDGMRVGKLSGVVGTYAAVDPEVERIACERLGLEPAPTSTQIIQRDRHAELLCALALVAASLETFALEIRHLARTEVGEVAEPFGRGQKGSSAMPHKRNPVVAERICGLARVVRAQAVIGLENVALWHERDISHSSAERVAIPDAFLALDYMLDRFAWLVEGWSSGPSGCSATSRRASGSTPASGCCSRWSSAGSRATTPTGSSSATPCAAWDEERPLRELVAADAEIAARVDLDEVFDDAAYTEPRRHRLRAPRGAPITTPRGGPCMSEVVHVGSGKVRELYALDDERLLLIASDRISTFDVVLPTEIPDKGRVLTGLSAFWFARTRDIVPNHLLAIRPDGRSIECRRLEMLPIECVVRGYLSGSGWKDYRATGAVCGHRLPEGLTRVRPAARADLHAGDQGDDRPRREHHARAGRRARRRRALRARRSAISIALYRFGADYAARARDPARRHEVRARRRPRRPAGAGRRGADAGLVALLAGGRVPRRAARSRPSTSSSCATTARRSAGTRPTPARSCPTTSSPAHAHATSRRSSG